MTSTFSRILAGTALAALLLFLPACEEPSKDPEPRVERPSTAPADTPENPPKNDPPAGSASTPPAWTPHPDTRTAHFVGLAAPKPATWREQRPSNSMRSTQYVVPGRDGSNQAHVIVYFFGAGQGGDVDSNIDRWQMQFRPDEQNNLVEPIIERFESNGLPVTLVELAGDYMKMGTQWYTADQLFLAAIVEREAGNVFVRLVGSTKTVEQNRDDFMAMLSGLHVE